MRKVGIACILCLLQFALHSQDVETQDELSSSVVEKPTFSISYSQSERNGVVNLTSYDVSFQNYYPMGRYRDFSVTNLGAGGQLNAGILNLDSLRAFAAFNVSQNVTTTERMTNITDLYLAVGAGWTFNTDQVIEGSSITPSISYGYMPHLVYGDYYLQNTTSFYAFSDQLFNIQCEFAYNFKDDSLPFSEIFFTPAYMWFTEEEYQGHQFGLLFGVRFPFKKPAPKDITPPVPVLLGQVSSRDIMRNSFLVEWDSAEDDVDSDIRYTLFTAPEGGISDLSDLTDRGEEIVELEASETTYLLNGLMPGQMYHVYVVASDKSGNSHIYKSNSTKTIDAINKTMVSPAVGAIEVDLEQWVKIPFYVDLDETTISQDTIQVYDGEVPVDGEVSYKADTKTMFFKAENFWAQGTEHTVVLGDDLRDNDGNYISNDFTFTFNTLSYDDIFAHWKFNNNTLDSSGNNNTATLKTWNKGDLPEYNQLDEVNAALHFYGGYNWGNYVDLGTINMGDTFSITGWVYIENPPEEYSRKIMTFISNGNAGADKDGFKVFFNNWNKDDKRIVIETGNGSDNKNAETQEEFIAYNNWYHIAVVIDRPSGSVKLFFNGAKAETTNGGEILSDFNVNAPLHVAQFKDGYFHFTGYIDDLRIYKRDLSDDEIETIARQR